MGAIMRFNKQVFFNEIRSSLFRGGLNSEQVKGLEIEIDIWLKYYSNYPNRYLAYCMATSYHETGRTHAAVREAFADSDEQAISRLSRHKATKKKTYWHKKSNGHSYYGRGKVQLTHDYNYKKAGEELGIDLYNNPDLALEPETSTHILFRGCIEGWFVPGQTLSRYLDGARPRYVQARFIVNGKDRRYKIAKYAGKFEKAIKEATAESYSVDTLRKAGSTTIKNADRINDIGVVTGVTGVASGVTAVKQVTETGTQIKDTITTATDLLVWAVQCWPLLLIVAAVALIYYAHQLKLNRVARETKIKRVKDDKLFYSQTNTNPVAV